MNESATWRWKDLDDKLLDVVWMDKVESRETRFACFISPLQIISQTVGYWAKPLIPNCLNTKETIHKGNSLSCNNLFPMAVHFWI